MKVDPALIAESLETDEPEEAEVESAMDDSTDIPSEEKLPDNAPRYLM